MQLFVGTSGGVEYLLEQLQSLGDVGGPMHAERYDDDALRTWAQRIGQTWDEAYVFFSHERSGPHLAARLIAIARDLGLEAPGA
ncbi:MAG: hypothetical protein AB1Z98_32705 [Nannocystaceae bacterium]